jgi:hypothetical protein
MRAGPGSVLPDMAPSAATRHPAKYRLRLPPQCRMAAVSTVMDGRMRRRKLIAPALLWLVIGASMLLASRGFPAPASIVVALKQSTADATYSRWLCYTRLIETELGRGPNGCTFEEYVGNHWHHWEDGAVHRFEFPDDGTVRFVSIGFAGARPEISLIGTPKGPWHIEWECPKFSGAVQRPSIAEREPAWVRLSEDLSSLVFTCGVAHPAAYPLARLQYAWYRRN